MRNFSFWIKSPSQKKVGRMFVTCLFTSALKWFAYQRTALKKRWNLSDACGFSGACGRGIPRKWGKCSSYRTRDSVNFQSCTWLNCNQQQRCVVHSSKLSSKVKLTKQLLTCDSHSAKIWNLSLNISRQGFKLNDEARGNEETFQKIVSWLNSWNLLYRCSHRVPSEPGACGMLWISDRPVLSPSSTSGPPKASDTWTKIVSTSTSLRQR